MKIIEDGLEAIEYLDTNDLPLFILLDLNLPKIDGFEILEFIRSNKRTKLVPVIILTSSDEEQDIKRAYGLGANSYIHKPIDFEKFQDVTQEIGSYWMMLNENPI